MAESETGEVTRGHAMYSCDKVFGLLMGSRKQLKNSELKDMVRFALGEQREGARLGGGILKEVELLGLGGGCVCVCVVWELGEAGVQGTAEFWPDS